LRDEATVGWFAQDLLDGFAGSVDEQRPGFLDAQPADVVEAARARFTALARDLATQVDGPERSAALLRRAPRILEFEAGLAKALGSVASQLAEVEARSSGAAAEHLAARLADAYRDA